MKSQNKLSITLFLITLMVVSINVKKASATWITNDAILTALVGTNFATQINQLVETVNTLKEQLEYTTKLAKAVSDGERTTEMILYMIDIAQQCGLEPVSILVDFNIDLSICNDTALKDAISAKFLIKYGEDDIVSKEVTLDNIAKLHKNIYLEGLTIGLKTRAVDARKKIEGWAMQLKASQSLTNQAHVSNSIQINTYSEMVEIRRLLGILVEQNSMILFDAQKFGSVE